MGVGVGLPYQPPRWLTSERIAAAAGAIGGAQVILDLLPEHGSSIRFLVFAFVEVTILVAAHLATRRGTTVGDAVAGAVVWIPLCFAAGAVSLALFGTLCERPWSAVGQWLSVLGGGLVFGFLFSIPVTLVALPLACVAATGRGRPSHDAPIRALVGGGEWLLAVDAMLFAATGGASALAPGVLMLAAGLVWLECRARFVRRVRAGREPAFVIVGLESEQAREGLMPFGPLRPLRAADLLAAVVPASAGPYRAIDQPVALCLLGRPGYAPEPPRR
jgi:hypothetical protein